MSIRVLAFRLRQTPCTGGGDERRGGKGGPACDPRLRDGPGQSLIGHDVALLETEARSGRPRSMNGMRWILPGGRCRRLGCKCHAGQALASCMSWPSRPLANVLATGAERSAGGSASRTWVSRVRRHLCSPAEWNAGGSAPRSVVEVQRGSRSPMRPGGEMTCTDREAPGKVTMCLSGLASRGALRSRVPAAVSQCAVWASESLTCRGGSPRWMPAIASITAATARYPVAWSSACAGRAAHGPVWAPVGDQAASTNRPTTAIGQSYTVAAQSSRVILPNRSLHTRGDQGMARRAGRSPVRDWSREWRPRRFPGAVSSLRPPRPGHVGISRR
jgi:hypothetical protein